MPLNPHIAWCREMQAWAREQLAAGACPPQLAVLGLSDALLEEVFILGERAKP